MLICGYVSMYICVCSVYTNVCLFVIVSSGAQMSQLICQVERPDTDVHPYSLPNLRKLLIVPYRIWQCRCPVCSMVLLFLSPIFLRCWNYTLELLMRVIEISFMWILGIQTHVFLLEWCWIIFPTIQYML